jgi:pyrophosphatase PpaX
MLNHPEPVRAVLFDLDGTLIDTFHLYLEAYSRALEPHLGRRPTAEDWTGRRISSERHFLAEWLGDEGGRECHAAMQRHYEALHGALCEGAYDGVREMLAGLRSAGYPVGIVTGKGRRAWEVTRDAVDLGAFEVVVTEDDVEFPKPHPAGLTVALEAMGVAPGAAVYIGDSVTDMEAGREAGMRVAGALWPKTAPGEKETFTEQIRRWQPAWLFERPADVVRTLAMWCG